MILGPEGGGGGGGGNTNYYGDIIIVCVCVISIGNHMLLSAIRE